MKRAGTAVPALSVMHKADQNAAVIEATGTNLPTR